MVLLHRCHRPLVPFQAQPKSQARTSACGRVARPFEQLRCHRCTLPIEFTVRCRSDIGSVRHSISACRCSTKSLVRYVRSTLPPATWPRAVLATPRGVSIASAHQFRNDDLNPFGRAAIPWRVRKGLIVMPEVTPLRTLGNRKPSRKNTRAPATTAWASLNSGTLNRVAVSQMVISGRYGPGVTARFHPGRIGNGQKCPFLSRLAARTFGRKLSWVPLRT